MTNQEKVFKAAIPYLVMNPTASIEAIAASASISKATFHRTFESRDVFFNQMADYAIETLKYALDQNTFSALESRVLHAVEILVAHGDKVSFLYNFSHEYNFDTLNQKLRHELALYYKDIEQAYDQGVLNQEVPLVMLEDAIHALVSNAWVQVHMQNVTYKQAFSAIKAIMYGGIVHETDHNK